jgi:hypothetical protein
VNYPAIARRRVFRLARRDKIPFLPANDFRAPLYPHHDGRSGPPAFRRDREEKNGKGS